MAVEVLAGSVVAHGGSWVGLSGRDLHVTEVDAGVEPGGDVGVPEHVGVDASLSPVSCARARSRRVAQCRFIRLPVRLRRTGPVARSPMARSIARPTAGGSGARTILSPLP